MLFGKQWILLCVIYIDVGDIAMSVNTTENNDG